MAQVFKSEKQFINTLYDTIKTTGAMDTIITDGGKYEIFLRNLFIKPYDQNPTINIKTKLNRDMVMSRGTLIPLHF